MKFDLDSDWDFVDAAGDWITVQCPYCGEQLQILLDPELEGSLVQDCEVCCNPWQMRVRRQAGEAPEVSVEQL